MARRIWIVARGTEITQEVRDDAIAQNCPEIVNGIPPALEGIIDEASLPMAFEEPEPPEPTPPLSTHLARLDNINTTAVKPATVTRLFLTETGVTSIWDVTGEEYSYDCYVSQSVVDEWQAGKIAAGDFVFIEFLEGDVTKPIVTLKVFKTW